MNHIILSCIAILFSIPAIAAPSIARLTLVNTDNNLAISGYDPIPNNSTLNLATLPSRHLSIVANSSPSVIGSVKFNYDSGSRNESIAPYALCNDNGVVPYDCNFTLGNHTLTVTPYSAAGATGTAGTPVSIAFTVIDQVVVAPQINKLSLINTDNGQVIAGYDSMSGNVSINFSTLPTRHLSAISSTTPSTVGSVKLTLDGVSHFENVAPYALCNDNGITPYDCNLSVGSHTLSATPYSGTNGSGNAGSTVNVNLTIIDQTPAPQIASLALINTDTNQVISGYGSLQGNVSIDLNTLPTRHLSIVATTTTAAGSVKLVLDNTTQMETSSPYSLCGHMGTVPIDCAFSKGLHAISAVPYSGANGTGSAGNSASVSLTVSDSILALPTITSLTLINADTGLPVAAYDPLPNNATLDLAKLPSRNLSVRANTNPSIVGSVKMTLDASTITQNTAPYSLCNDSAPTYYPCPLGVGTHTISVQPYSGASLSGTAGSAVNITTNIVDTSTIILPPPSGKLTAVWANDGGDKVTRNETRATTNSANVINSLWDGTKVKVFGGKNEVVAFNLVLEAKTQAATSVAVSFNNLTGPGGFQIKSAAASGNGVFDWTQRNIELFYVKYLKIEGLSALSYETYDERHIPARMRRPFTGAGLGTGGWVDRPDHDKFYPEIAVPAELNPTFNIALGENQSIWTDIYIPKSAPTGVYTGTVSILEAGLQTRQVPVELTVRNFTLPDAPSSKTMVYFGYNDINQRYLGQGYPTLGSANDTASKLIRDRHFQIAHRHKISLIDQDVGAASWGQDRPRPEWTSRLDGTLFTAANGYNGPGVATGNGVYSIGTYSSWSWKGQVQSAMNTHSDAWVNWFQTNSPSTEFFLYLIDESTNYAQTQQWANWIANNPGPGRNLASFATLNLPDAVANVPDLDIAASWFVVGDNNKWQTSANSLVGRPDKRFYLYNGKRPASGSFATEDDGVALRELPWGQYKKGISRWFFWESTYYNDTQSGRGQNSLFQNAQTFGGFSSTDPVKGKTGWNHSNGDGVLFYPGTDTLFPSDSYGVQGPLTSLRLKHWRRGIQDVDYITLASAIDPARVQLLINQAVPKVLWENGIADPADPTWQRCDISWSNRPDDWEALRSQLANIIEGH